MCINPIQTDMAGTVVLHYLRHHGTSYPALDIPATNNPPAGNTICLELLSLKQVTRAHIVALLSAYSIWYATIISSWACGRLQSKCSVESLCVLYLMMNKDYFFSISYNACVEHGWIKTYTVPCDISYYLGVWILNNCLSFCFHLH